MDINENNLHSHRFMSYKLTSNFMQSIGLQRVTELQKEYIDGYPSVVLSEFYLFVVRVYGIEDTIVKTFFDSSVFFLDNPSIYYQRGKSSNLYNIEKQSIERWLTF